MLSLTISNENKGGAWGSGGVYVYVHGEWQRGAFWILLTTSALIHIPRTVLWYPAEILYYSYYIDGGVGL